MIWIFFAAFFNAVMDRTENESFFGSRFDKLSHKFWYKRESWKWAKKIFGYKLDAWHLSKTCMIVCLALAAANTWIEFLVIGLVWNATFNFFYHAFGRKKI